MVVERQVAFRVITQHAGPISVIIIVYASTCKIEYHHLRFKVSMAMSLDLPSLLVKDFNYLISLEDKKGGRSFKINREIHEFHAFLRQTDLIDLDFSGPK